MDICKRSGFKLMVQNSDLYKLASNETLQHISFENIKNVFKTVLADPVAGPRAREALVAHQEQALVESRAKAEQECKLIAEEAVALLQYYQDIGAMLDSQDRTEGRVDSHARSMRRLLPKVRALFEKGPLVEGPTLAWTALLHVASCAIPEETNDATVSLEEVEDASDWLHNEIDEMMVGICRVQQESRPSWLSEHDWREDSECLRQKAKGNSGPCTHRYPRTMIFLTNVKNGEKPRPKKSKKRVASSGIGTFTPSLSSPSAAPTLSTLSRARCSLEILVSKMG
ncbi:hypothetical protein H2200_000449 [Cladophialophora chaetospira]|uniref:Uncharacterized protein n=1 Tax=Cladophialophora chaetospira TaxID=386627 RepID=A0AA38XNG1_9EURO|nr:hypothetical protein H2200_000449 [Cladophialophora chaetospira]